ncbi:hypothetical protein EV683_12337 [Crenobacter luteus]|nr:hypothetical protein EV683_12337 [Crenobacter luteus]
MNIMITGIGSMVGTHMTDYLYECGGRPVGLYFNSTAPLFDVDRNCLGVIHRLAVQSYPAALWLCPADTLDINLVGTVNVCEVCQ